MAKQTPKHDGGAEASARKPPKKVFAVLGAVLVLVGAGGAGAWYLSNNGANRGGSEKGQSERPPLFLPLETFTVNLRGEAADQYLQLGVTLKVDDQAQIDLLKLHMPEVRSRLITLLSSKKSSEILTPEGKRNLSDEIVEQVRQPLTASSPPPGVSAVFFTSFVVQ
jgi:flagellar FliL protein